MADQDVFPSFRYRDAPGAIAWLVDVDHLYERARSKGAEVTHEIEDADYGSRGFSVKDPEGNVWSFGTYRPSAS